MQIGDNQTAHQVLKKTGAKGTYMRRAYKKRTGMGSSGAAYPRRWAAGVGRPGAGDTQRALATLLFPLDAAKSRFRDRGIGISLRSEHGKAHHQPPASPEGRNHRVWRRRDRLHRQKLVGDR